MQVIDLKALETRLNELSEALGGRPVSAGALKVWRDTLAECAFSDVLFVLTDWAKSHAKAPLPSEVLRLARDRRSQSIEDQAKRDAVGAPEFAPEKFVANTDIAHRAMAEIRKILSVPKPDPRIWASRLRDRKQAGEKLTWAQEYWLSEYVRLGHSFVGVDREAQLEREAIQAESA